MEDEEKTLNVIDQTIKAAEASFKEFIEVLETSRTALLNLESDKVELSNAKETLENEKIQLEEVKRKLETEKQQLEVEKTKLEEATEKLEIENNFQITDRERMGSATLIPLRISFEHTSAIPTTENLSFDFTFKTIGGIEERVEAGQSSLYPSWGLEVRLNVILSY